MSLSGSLTTPQSALGLGRLGSYAGNSWVHPYQMVSSKAGRSAHVGGKVTMVPRSSVTSSASRSHCPSAVPSAGSTAQHTTPQNPSSGNQVLKTSPSLLTWYCSNQGLFLILALDSACHRAWGYGQQKPDCKCWGKDWDVQTSGNSLVLFAGPCTTSDKFDCLAISETDCRTNSQILD